MTDDPPYSLACSFEEPGSNPGTTDTGAPPHPSLFTAEFWATRDLAKPDFLLSELLTTTSRMLLIGPTGSGKTNFAMALAFAIASGSPFLHWTGRRPARVLYIDGEMSARLAKDRVQQAIARHGSMPDTLWVINRHDFPDMPALNGDPGQKFVELMIESLGGVDLIVFDNIQAVLVGSHKEDETWAPVLPWIKKLTAMKIGQLWMHHTGHATDRGYGDKTREWQFDTVALMKVPEPPTLGRLIEFRLEFTKKRECTPSNRADFETADIWLDEGDVWRSTASPAKASNRSKGGLTPEYLKALDHLHDAMVKHGEFVTANDIPKGSKVLPLNHWRDRLKQRGLYEDSPASKQWFYRTKKALIAEGKIVIDGAYVWATKP